MLDRSMPNLSKFNLVLVLDTRYYMHVVYKIIAGVKSLQNPI